MKKLIVVGIAAALALTGCGAAGSSVGNSSGGYEGGFSDFDIDLNNRSVYNDRTYCGGDTYIPLANNEYTCEDRDHKRKKAITKRPTPILPKRVTPAPQQQQQQQQQQQKSAPRQAQKAPARSSTKSK